MANNLGSPKASLKSINSMRKLNSSKTVNGNGNGIGSIHLVETVDVIGEDNNNNNNNNNRFMFNTPKQYKVE